MSGYRNDLWVITPPAVKAVIDAAYHLGLTSGWTVSPWPPSPLPWFARSADADPDERPLQEGWSIASESFNVIIDRDADDNWVLTASDDTGCRVRADMRLVNVLAWLGSHPSDVRWLAVRGVEGINVAE